MSSPALAKLSLVNHWASAVAVTGTTPITGYPLAGVQSPERPFLTYRSNTTTNVEVIAQMAGTPLVELVLLVNCNFSTVHYQANPTNAWGAPSFASGAQTVAVNPWNQRRTLAYVLPAGVSLAFHRVFIPTQAPTDGTSYFEVGGIWAGPLTVLPRGWRWGFEVDPREGETQLEVRAELGGWSNSYDVGDLATKITAVRQVEFGTPDLAAFRAVDRAWVLAKYGALWLNLGSSAEAWVMRARPRPWRFGDDLHPVSETELDEVLAG